MADFRPPAPSGLAILLLVALGMTAIAVYAVMDDAPRVTCALLGLGVGIVWMLFAAALDERRRP